ncbi:sensor histidine kinase [Candidatus Uabimicrobium amorphum]|uniref:histidine kinase n=1 Tax=Uabimicrobium amorphum TaxID=2596890 RepID=A0A5S9ILV2_UABAM|nr:HAMP domain-containing sensor histidine kinase [Candidatus Uabimicrobium amorphum]BBM83920.1 two-component sensor histidine kinase [Candidatus Uabimicrobium amorphum]
MLSKSRLFHSIAFRSTILYTIIFGVFLCGAFASIYFFVADYIANIEDQWLIQEAKQIHEMSKDPQSLPKTLAKMKEGTKALGAYQVFYCLKDANNKIIASTDQSIWKEVLTSTYQDMGSGFFIETLLIAQGQHPLRIIYFPYKDGRILHVVYSLRNSTAFLNRLLRSFIYIFPGLLIVFYILGFIMMRNTLKPIRDMTQSAHKIAIDNLNQKIPVKNPKDELGMLAITLNKMLSRIDSLVNNIKEMCDNLAHDIRTPITRIQGASEVALMQKRSSEEYCEVLYDCVSESKRLLHWLNTLLDISEAEAKISIHREKFIINDLIDEVVEMFEPIAQHKNIELSYESVDEKICIFGDIKKLRRAIVNLVDNAIKYTSTGKVTVGITKEEARVGLFIKDTGMGIPNKDLRLIFNRFYRSDTSRSMSGSGLGLALVKAIVHAHRGKILVQSKVNHGSVFKILLSA